MSVKTNQPLESKIYTREEGAKLFVQKVSTLVDYWKKVESAPEGKSVSDFRVEGVAHSILATIDGCSVDMPAYKLVPVQDVSTIEDSLMHNIPVHEIDTDIAGGLHTILHKELLGDRALLTERDRLLNSYFGFDKSTSPACSEKPDVSVPLFTPTVSNEELSENLKQLIGALSNFKPTSSSTF